MSSRMKAFIALMVASVFWASAGVAAKTLLKVFDPLSLAAVRLSLASIVILPFLLATKKLTAKIVLDVLPVALFSTGNFILFLFGVQRTTANAAGMIYTATPLVTTLLAHMLIGEKITRRKITGILVGLLGVITILLLPVLDKHGVLVGDLTGNLIIVGAMLCFASYNVGSRHLIEKKKYHPITLTGISLMTSAAIFLLLSFFIPHRPILSTLQAPSIAFMILYISIFVTVLPYVLHQWAVKHSSATTASLTSYIQPVFSFIFNGIFLGEILTGGFVFGVILVFAGVILATGMYRVRLFGKALTS